MLKEPVTITVHDLRLLCILLLPSFLYSCIIRMECTMGSINGSLHGVEKIVQAPLENKSLCIFKIWGFIVF